jgi:hypothetical protein
LEWHRKLQQSKVAPQEPRKPPTNGLSSELRDARVEWLASESYLALLTPSENKDMKISSICALLGYISGIMAPPCVLAQEGAMREASLPYLTLRVHLSQNYAGVPKLVEYFSTADARRHSVVCVSAFFDVRYVLKDGSNQVVPIDKEPWKHGSDQISGGGGYATGMSDPCKTIKQDQATRAVLLTYFYPNLAPGLYTLQITLAPRGTNDRATLAPLTVKV